MWVEILKIEFWKERFSQWSSNWNFSGLPFWTSSARVLRPFSFQSLFWNATRSASLSRSEDLLAWISGERFHKWFSKLKAPFGWLLEPTCASALRLLSCPNLFLEYSRVIFPGELGFRILQKDFPENSFESSFAMRARAIKSNDNFIFKVFLEDLKSFLLGEDCCLPSLATVFEAGNFRDFWKRFSKSDFLSYRIFWQECKHSKCSSLWGRSRSFLYTGWWSMKTITVGPLETTLRNGQGTGDPCDAHPVPHWLDIMSSGRERELMYYFLRVKYNLVGDRTRTWIGFI